MSKLVFGTGGRFGRLSDSLATELVYSALHSGISSFDTGLHYAGGKSHAKLLRILNQFSRNTSQPLFISSKISVEYLLNASLHDIVLRINQLLPDRPYLDVLFLWGPSVSDLEDPRLNERLITLSETGVVKEYGINSHSSTVLDYLIAENIPFPFSHVMLDYNILLPERNVQVDSLSLMGCSVWGGTVLAQGFLIQNLFQLYLRTRSLSYLARALLQPETRTLMHLASSARRYLQRTFPNNYASIPLSYALQKPQISFVPVGMLSHASIAANLSVEASPLPSETIQCAASTIHRLLSESRLVS